jgi:hypothetical protein
MKHSDAFMLGMSIFIAANCISYFVYSGTPFVAGWYVNPTKTGDILEKVGFPFVVYSISIGMYSWYPLNLAGNFAIAMIASFISANRFNRFLPPLWHDYTSFRYSLLGLFVVTTIFCLLISIAMINQFWGHAIEILVCLCAPVLIYSWHLYSKNIGWLWLAIDAIGLTIFVLIIDIHYRKSFVSLNQIIKAFIPILLLDKQSGLSDERWELSITRWIVGASVIRVAVPIFGLISLMVILQVIYAIMGMKRKG